VNITGEATHFKFLLLSLGPKIIIFSFQTDPINTKTAFQIIYPSY